MTACGGAQNTVNQNAQIGEGSNTLVLSHSGVVLCKYNLAAGDSAFDMWRVCGYIVFNMYVDCWRRVQCVPRDTNQDVDREGVWKRGGERCTYLGGRHTTQRSLGRFAASYGRGCCVSSTQRVSVTHCATSARESNMWGEWEMYFVARPIVWTISLCRKSFKVLV